MIRWLWPDQVGEAGLRDVERVLEVVVGVGVVVQPHASDEVGEGDAGDGELAAEVEVVEQRLREGAQRVGGVVEEVETVQLHGATEVRWDGGDFGTEAEERERREEGECDEKRRERRERSGEREEEREKRIERRRERRGERGEERRREREGVGGQRREERAEKRRAAMMRETETKAESGEECGDKSTTSNLRRRVTIRRSLSECPGV